MHKREKIMYKKILLCGDKNQFLPFNYNVSTAEASRAMGQNSGNNVFGFALQKMTLCNNVQVDMRPIEWVVNNTDIINEKYDACLYSPANILAVWAKNSNLPMWTETLKKIKIPFHFVGVGAQSDRHYNLNFVESIQNEGYEFIKSILNTGGRIGLRGYFTADVVKKLGFKEEEFTVTGCPSIFMNGPDIKIEKKNITRENLKPIFNGNHFWFSEDFHHYFYDYPQSIFVCQDLFYALLYDIQSFDKKDLYLLQGSLFADMFKENRIRLYCDYLAWDKDIRENKFNFCVGSRIHGNVTSLLAGIPSFVDAVDSRVRELAEFFDIPHGYIEDSQTDLLKLYETADFTNFNKTFSLKYKNFKKFMENAGLPCLENINTINKEISKLNFKQPKIKTSYKKIENLSVFPPNDDKKKKSKIYNLIHLKWLKGER